MPLIPPATPETRPLTRDEHIRRFPNQHKYLPIRGSLLTTIGLGAGIALGLMVGAGRHHEAGAGFLSADEECVEADASLFPLPHQTVSIAGADIGISISGGRSDDLEITNRGNGEVFVNTPEDGAVSFDDEDDDKTGQTFYVDQTPASFSYTEDDARVNIHLSHAQGDDTVVVRYEQICNATP
jgi:hypothetical protein